MGVTVTTSHAAPFIRYQLVHEVGQAVEAKTQKDRQAHYAAAQAYGKALGILADAVSTNEPDGIADVESIPKRYLAEAFRFLGGEAGWQSKGMGPEPTWDFDPFLETWMQVLDECAEGMNLGTADGRAAFRVEFQRRSRTCFVTSLRTLADHLGVQDPLRVRFGLTQQITQAYIDQDHVAKGRGKVIG